MKTIVKDNTISVKNTDQLLKEIDAMAIQLNTAELMVRQLQAEIAQKDAEEDEKLRALKEQAEAAAAAGNAAEANEAAQATIAALELEVKKYRHKFFHVQHKVILHKLIKAQSESVFASLRDSHEEGQVQLRDLEGLLEVREREKRDLQARVDELEKIVASGVGGGIAALGGGGGGGAGGVRRRRRRQWRRRSAPAPWSEETISAAEAELKAAMAAGDPERLKKAIANASQTVAKARARGNQVLKKAQVLHGDGDASAAKPKLEHMVTAMDALNDDEAAYIRFHDIATARKLALASRGFEVQNVFIDSLWDLAQKSEVPSKDWGEFIRLELPSPRFDDEDEEEDDDVAGADEGSVVEYQLEDGAGGVRKVKKAVRKMANLMGWRSKLGKICATYRSTAEHFGMDEPDEMPAPDVSDGAGGARRGRRGRRGRRRRRVALGETSTPT